MAYARTWVLMIALTTTPAVAEDVDARVQESRAVVKSFMEELKGELQTAMKAGGPVNAIEVCQAKAPQIAARHAEAKGWEVGRTSLKRRNPDNAPDEWERDVLERFEQRKAAGEDPKALEHWEVVQRDGGQQFRYMKAIPTGEPCLACHGEKLDPEVARKLDALYPGDQARGFRAGDLRGAFTIVQPM